MTISEKALMMEASKISGNNCKTPEEAINEFANISEYDEIYSVEGSEPENAVRFCQWILWTDSQGNMTANDYGQEHIADYLMECYRNGVEYPGGF